MRQLPQRLVLAVTLAALFAAPALAGPPGQYDAIIDWPMYEDPVLPVAENLGYRFHPRLKELWLAALARPDAGTAFRAADALGRAFTMGHHELADTAPELQRVLSKPGQHALVQVAAARTLIRMEARPAAPQLLELNRQGRLDLVLLTDPALAAWRHEPAVAVWRERAAEASVDLVLRISAIESLGSVRDAQAAEVLRPIALDRSAAATLRVAAAKELGQIATAGLETVAEPLTRHAGLAANNQPPASVTDRLVAAYLLAHHQGEPAQALLLRLADDPEPAVAALSLQRLLAIDPLLVRPLGEKLLRNADATVRLLAAEAVSAQKSTQAVSLLTPLLDDPVPVNRRTVRDRMIALAAEPGLAEAAKASGVAMLATDRWRAQEQAAFLLGKLDHKPAAPRLLELLEAARLEPRLASAVALRWLAVPETLGPQLEHVQRLSALGKELERKAIVEDMLSKAAADPEFDQWLRARGPLPEVPRGPEIDHRSLKDTELEISQIVQGFGTLGYDPAMELLRSYVPKHSVPWYEGRAAAIWSLGKLLESSPDETLAGQLRSRIEDYGGMNPDPERNNVRRFCAITLGRMKVASAMPTLEFARGFDEVGQAAYWAMEQITGAEAPTPPPVYETMPAWFIEPLTTTGE